MIIHRFLAPSSNKQASRASLGAQHVQYKEGIALCDPWDLRSCGEMYQDKRLSLRNVMSTSRCRDTQYPPRWSCYQLTPPPRVCCTARRISTCSSAAYLTDLSRVNSKAEGPNVPGDMGDIGLMAVGDGLLSRQDRITKPAT